MKTAIVSDIHSNLEALQTVLKHAQEQGCTQHACLGDIIGYGANPVECLAIVQAMNCPTVRGNHDMLCSRPLRFSDARDLNPLAAQAIEWTYKQLSEENRSWLGNLPYTLDADSFTIVHSSLNFPESWEYVVNKHFAKFSLDNQKKSICFNGHTHKPEVFLMHSTGIQAGTYSRITIDSAVKYLINVGSVGQPRDNNPKTSYAIFDSEKNIVELQRLDYDFRETQRKILAAGLPHRLADRLESGK